MNKALSLGLCLSTLFGTVGIAAAAPDAGHHHGAKKAAPKGAPAPTPTPPAAPDAAPLPTGLDPPPAPPAPGPTDPANPDPDHGNKGLQGKTDAPQPAERPWAVGVAEGEREKALALFHDGNVQLNDGIFVQAADKYREALKHWDHPAINYNLALALMNLDQPVDVFEALTKATKYGAAPLENDKFERAKGYLLLVEKQVATIEVTCDKPGAKVSVDGKEAFIGPGKFTALVRTGKHNFVAEKQGYNARVNAPYIGGGEHFRIELKLYTAEELTRYRREWNKTWAPWAVVGGGVAIAAIGGLLEVSAQSSFKDFDAQVAKCGTTGCDITPALTNVKSSGDTKQTMSYVGYGLGGATVITGLVLAYINRNKPYQIRPEDLGEQAPVTFAPIVSPGMTGGMAEVHF
jgi:hypothetical protein